MTHENLEKKWAEVLDYALQHATGQGSRTGFRWLQDAFNEYFQAHEEAVENGTCVSFGGQSFGQHNREVMGQSFGQHNREVMAEKICLELGHHVGGQHLIDEDQEDRLKASLKEITESSQRSRGFRR